MAAEADFHIEIVIAIGHVQFLEESLRHPAAKVFPQRDCHRLAGVAAAARAAGGNGGEVSSGGGSISCGRVEHLDAFLQHWFGVVGFIGMLQKDAQRHPHSAGKNCVPGSLGIGNGLA